MKTSTRDGKSEKKKKAMMETRGVWGCNGEVLNEFGGWRKGKLPVGAEA